MLNCQIVILFSLPLCTLKTFIINLFYFRKCSRHTAPPSVQGRDPDRKVVPGLVAARPWQVVQNPVHFPGRLGRASSQEVTSVPPAGLDLTVPSVPSGGEGGEHPVGANPSALPDRPSRSGLPPGSSRCSLSPSSLLTFPVQSCNSLSTHMLDAPCFLGSVP